MVNIYCDGSTKTNPGAGSYGVIALDENNKILYTYREEQENTTNNRMELEALIHALKLAYVKYNNQYTTIYSDSAYCVNAYHQWIETWHNNGWRRQRNQQVENLDLMKQIYEIKNAKTDFFCNEPKVEKVKGHKGNLGNELCDAIAAGNASKFEKFYILGNCSILKNDN